MRQGCLRGPRSVVLARTLFALSNDVPDIDSFVFDRSFPLPMEETRFVTGKAPITLTIHISTPILHLAVATKSTIRPRPLLADVASVQRVVPRMRPAWPNTCCLTFSLVPGNAAEFPFLFCQGYKILLLGFRRYTEKKATSALGQVCGCKKRKRWTVFGYFPTSEKTLSVVGVIYNFLNCGVFRIGTILSGSLYLAFSTLEIADGVLYWIHTDGVVLKYVHVAGVWSPVSRMWAGLSSA